MLKPFRFSDYVHLEMNARAVLSDSGTISEEASILNLRALNIRQAHERPEAMEEASVMLTGFAWPRIAEALRILETQPRGEDRLLRPGCRLRGAARFREGRAADRQLHRLRAPHGLGSAVALRCAPPTGAVQEGDGRSGSLCLFATAKNQMPNIMNMISMSDSLISPT